MSRKIIEVAGRHRSAGRGEDALHHGGAWQPGAIQESRDGRPGHADLSREVLDAAPLGLKVVLEPHAMHGSQIGYVGKQNAPRSGGHIGGLPDVANLATMLGMKADGRGRRRTPETALGAAIRRMRESKGWSLDRLAEEVGADKTTVGRLELGKRQLTERWIARFERALGASIVAAAVDDGHRPEAKAQSISTATAHEISTMQSDQAQDSIPPNENGGWFRMIEAIEGLAEAVNRLASSMPVALKVENNVHDDAVVGGINQGFGADMKSVNVGKQESADKKKSAGDE